jgi:HopA1 effector protein family
MSGATAPDLPQDLLAIARAVVIESPTRYSLLGGPREVPPPEEGSTEAPPLVQILATDLYVRLYTRLDSHSSKAASASAGDPLRLAQRDHVNALSVANDGTGTWEAGWRIASVDEDSRAAVIKDEVTFWVPPEGLRARRIAPGEPCRVRVGKELRNLVPGFYVAIGNGPGEMAGGPASRPDAEPPLVRLYWHLTPEAAVPYMAAATSLLNALGVPFRTKVLVDPTTYARADAGVLYLDRRQFGEAREAVREIHRRVAAGLRPEVPLFTRALAPGLGVAEDPGNGLSFGQARCRTAAAALWSAFRAARHGEQERAAALAEAFRSEGLDLAGLHLAPGSKASYSLDGSRVTPKKADRRRAR